MFKTSPRATLIFVLHPLLARHQCIRNSCPIQSAYRWIQKPFSHWMGTGRRLRRMAILIKRSLSGFSNMTSSWLACSRPYPHSKALQYLQNCGSLHLVDFLLDFRSYPVVFGGLCGARDWSQYCHMLSMCASPLCHLSPNLWHQSRMFLLRILSPAGNFLFWVLSSNM